jgi:hypothetical protein
MSEGEKIDLEETISSKGITLTPALTDLFRPTTKLLGKELRDFAKKKIDTIKERNRDKNLRFHLDKINEIVGNKGANANLQEDSENEQLLKNAEKLLESLEAVQDVEPSEKELSEIWQNLIASLRLGKSIPQHLITTLKALSPLEASILMQVKSKEDVGFPTKIFRLFRYVIFPLFGQNEVQGADKHYLELLKEKRLLKKTYLVEYFWVSTVISIVTAYFYITRRVPEGFVSRGEYPSDISILMMLMTLLMLPLMIIVNVLAYGINHDYGRYKLSWLGREILKYAPNEDKNKHNKANSADAKKPRG